LPVSTTKSRREMDLERWTVGGHHPGIGMTALLILTGRDPYHGVNAGFMALSFNFAVTALVDRMTTASVTGFEVTLQALEVAPSAQGAD